METHIVAICAIRTRITTSSLDTKAAHPTRSSEQQHPFYRNKKGNPVPRQQQTQSSLHDLFDIINNNKTCVEPLPI